MATDLDLNQQKDVHLDGTNDLALTSGIPQLEQSVAISVMNVLQDFVGGPVEGGTLGLLEERVREALDSNPNIAAIQAVSVESYDRRSETVTISARTIEGGSFDLEVST